MFEKQKGVVGDRVALELPQKKGQVSGYDVFNDDISTFILVLSK